MTKHTKYTGNASTEKEAEALAVSLLRQVVDIGEEYTVVTQKSKTAKIERVLLLPIGKEAASLGTPYFPAAYIETTGGDKDSTYRVYLLSDSSRLPFYFRYASPMYFLLPIISPIQKPEKPLPVEALLTYEGVVELETLVEGDAGESILSSRALKRIQEAPEEERLYSLFEDFGEMTPQEIKEELESGEYDGTSVIDASLLNAITGNTYRTEEDFLNALGDFAGKEGVERYKDTFLWTYRFEKAYNFVKWLTLEIIRTEDYRGVEAHYEEYASAIGFKEEYASTLIREDGIANALELALANSLGDFIRFSSYFDGFSEKRVAEYLNVPEDTIRKIYIKFDNFSLL